jgi:predicted Zn-dependent protease
MATAIESDPMVDASGAIKFYRAARQLDPENTAIACAFARLLAELGHTDKAHQLFRETMDRHSGDFSIVESFVQSLCDDEYFDVALREIALCRFRHAKNPRLQQLADLVNYFKAKASQSFARNDCSIQEPQSPGTVPFLRVTGEPRTGFHRHSAHGTPAPRMLCRPRVKRRGAN